MGRVIDLTPKRVLETKSLIDELRKPGIVGICPPWSKNATDCSGCKKMFPKRIGNHAACPCYNYTCKYLIKRLQEIIDYNEKRRT